MSVWIGLNEKSGVRSCGGGPMKSFGMNRGVETGRGKGETGEEQRRLG